MIVLCILVLTYFDFYYYVHCSVFMLSIKKIIMTVVKAGIFCVILDVLGLSFRTFSRFLNCTNGNKSRKASYL